eukprot:14390281-Alexandrium_andersonii.AAC.1
MCIRDSCCAGFSPPRATDCADCGLADCGLDLAISRFRDLRTPSRPAFVGRFGISTKNGAERTPRELRGPI